MQCPFGRCAHRGDDASVPVGLRLERDSVPALQCGFDGRPARRAIEEFENIVAMMRKVHVQPHPASVASAISAEQRIAERGRRAAVDRQIMLAAKLHRGMAHVDADVLTLRAGAMTQFRRSKANGRDARLRRSADPERRGQDGIVAGEMQMRERHIVSAGTPPQVGDDIGGQRRAAPASRSFSEGWWSRSGLNRRPLRCQRNALPAELSPLVLNDVIRFYGLRVGFV